MVTTIPRLVMTMTATKERNVKEQVVRNHIANHVPGVIHEQPPSTVGRRTRRFIQSFTINVYYMASMLYGMYTRACARKHTHTIVCV